MIRMQMVEAWGKTSVRGGDTAIANFLGVLMTLPLLLRLRRASAEGGAISTPGGGTSGRLSRGGIGRVVT